SAILDPWRPARDTPCATVTRHHGGRAFWSVCAVVLLCGTASVASARTTGRRGAHRTSEAEAPVRTPQPPKVEPTPLDGPRWQLTSYRGGDGQSVTPLDGSRPTARFRDGRIITGSAGCNTFTAGYTYDDGNLTVSHPAATTRSCPPAVMEQEA